MSGAVSFMAKAIGSVCFVGYFPLAPGTMASLVTLLSVWFFQPTLPVHLAVLAVVTVLGVWSAGCIERGTGTKDNRIIVIDEAAGCLVSVLLIPLSSLSVVAAFFLFRFFDILKPPPIRWIERNIRGGWGVMLDDLAAGVAANLVLQLLTSLQR